MKDIKCFIRVAVIMLISICCLIIATYSATSVNAEDGVVEIYTVEDLYSINLNMDYDYVLMNDLDLSEVTAEGGDFNFMGNGWEPIGGQGIYGDETFSGTFDGKGHKITGINQNLSKVPSGAGEILYLGLFSNVSGDVKNLSVSGTFNVGNIGTKVDVGSIAGKVSGNIVNVSADCDVTGNYNTGGLIGQLTDTGNVLNCKSYGDVESQNYKREDSTSYNNPVRYYDYYAYAGGIAALSDGIVEQACNYGKVTGSIEGDTIVAMYTYNRLYCYVGGIVGTGSGTVLKSYNNGAIDLNINNGKNYSRAAGICVEGKIYNSYNTGNLTGNCKGYSIGYSSVDCYSIGMGYEEFGNSAVNGYYLSGSAGTTTGAKSLTESQMKNINNYTGLDTENVWTIDGTVAYKYPQLIDNRQDCDKEIDMIKPISIPEKTTYYNDEESLDYTGGRFKVYYLDGTNEIKDIAEEMTSGYDLSVPGAQSVTVTYRGYSFEYQINVSKRADIIQVKLVSQPNIVTFVRGTEFNVEGLSVRVSYADGTSKLISPKASEIEGVDINKSGDYVATYPYKGFSVEFDVHVVPVDMTSIEIAKEPSQTVYELGEELNTEGLKVLGKYNDGSQKEISNYKISGYKGELGINTILVSVEDFTDSFEVTVQEGSPDKLIVSNLPTKVKYVEGELFNPDGMIVLAAYASGFQKEIKGYKVSGFTGKVGTNEVIITYKGVKTRFNVTIIVKKIEAIEVTNLPDRTTYDTGIDFNPTGLEITALYNDNTEIVIENYELSGADTTKPGVKTVTVSFEGKTTSFNIVVVEATVESIDVIEPSKKIYMTGESLDLSDMKVMANYSNGKSYEISDYEVNGYTGNPGVNNVIVSYMNETWSFTVKVHNPSTEWIVVKEATCQEKGERVKYCKECGEVATREELEKLNHKVVADNVIEATCEKPGLTEGAHCAVCNTVLVPQKEIPAQGHSCSKTWTVTIPADCEEWGSQVKKCTVCDKVLVSEAVEPIGHASVVDKAVKPTCSKAGKTEGSHCSVCGKVLVPQKQTSIDTEAHSYGEWCVAKEASCIDEGREERKCSECGETETRAIAITEHLPGKEADCEEDQVCTVCGKVLVSRKGHIPGKEATCDEDQVCTVCGKVLESEKGHIPGDEPNCTEPQVCLVCHSVLSDALGHDYSSDWVIDEEATCTNEGQKSHHCIRCNERCDITPVEKNPHNYITVKGYAAKIGVAGLSDGVKCSICGAWKSPQVEIAPKNPSAVRIISISGTKKAFTVKWRKSSSANATGYQVRYSLKPSMPSAKTVTVASNSITSKKILKLKPKKKYYIQVRTYKTVSGKKYYSSWSSKRAVTTK